ncbi:TRZ/ATZ family hydrolase [Sutterella sp.]|uniref:TRZ/ATZ family hydrolase n=1 Tax=Sutterella sp. TaxID=1981025 RepID=UPI0026DFB275|nr:TRZ/ATZ family hydrolase [Sutterella sp.]MDO5530593.1 TRZ/ATZ family hydrolase [Sutterella sp.]
MQADILIEARWVIPVAPRGVILENTAVAVREGRIAAILPIEEARASITARETVSLPQSALLPGFVNLHTHVAMNLVRGLGADLPLMDWLTTKIWPAEGKLMSPEWVRDGAWLAGLEMAAGGVTTASDHYFFPKSAAEGLRKAGLRCVVSGIVIGFPTAWAKNEDGYLEASEELFTSLGADPLVRASVGPHAPYTVSDRALKACAELSEKYSLPIHMHVNETAGEVSDSIRDHGCRPIERLDRLGLVNDRLIAVHMVHSNDADIARIAEAGASICHCPCSNLKLASGFAPFPKFLEAGINVGIGTDGAASNDKLDMLGETRLAAMLDKCVSGDPTSAPVFAMLEAATLGGARALKWDDEIGSIELGKAADMFAINLAGPESLPVQDPAAQILYASGREAITHTWVAGELIMKKNVVVEYRSGAEADQAVAIAQSWQNRI